MNDIKKVDTPDYKYLFNYKTGGFVRCGKTIDDDPIMSPLGPEIFDMEVSTICKGIGSEGPCQFCYKSNTPNGKNMSFETFKKIFHKLPTNLTQIAFGADAQCKSNPEIWDMMNYCRENDYNKVIPNITVADIDDETADKLASLCGAVAVSRYDDKNYCYDSVKKLVDRGMTQVNIHVMISEETFENSLASINEYREDSRLNGMNAIVFLSLKRKGRGIGFTPLSQDKFKLLIDTAFAKNVKIGFDSCSAHKFLDSIKGHENYDKLEMNTEPCESFLFSNYCNVDGVVFPCSFCEDEPKWKEGLSIVDCDDYMKDIWNGGYSELFRSDLLGNQRKCPVFTI